MQNTERMWADSKGFRMEDFSKPDPFAHVSHSEFGNQERVGKYNARIVRVDSLGVDPIVNIFTPDFDTEDEARTHALNIARNTPGANRIIVERVCRDPFNQSLYGECVDQIESTDAAWQAQDEAAQSTSEAEKPAWRSRVGRRTLARTRRNTLHAATRTTKALAYRTLSGIIATFVDTGRLIRTGDFLQRIGGGDLPDGQQSWFGRHVKRAYRAQHGGDPIRVWAQHRTTGRWIHVHVYFPLDEALYAGLRSYKGTRHLLASTYAEAA